MGFRSVSVCGLVVRFEFVAFLCLLVLIDNWFGF